MRFAHLLLDHGADATALDSTSNGVLQYAAFSAQTELIAPLLAAGADQHINRASRGGFTPLLTAVAEGHLHVARQLLRAGAVQGACGQKQPTELTVLFPVPLDATQRRQQRVALCSCPPARHT